MSSDKSALRTLLAKKRAEELGSDVWEHFVIPPFCDRLDLYTFRKPKVIIGGRGCGKTMLLRYLSHSSMFSPNRSSVPEENLSTIGLYWRADTQFASAMNGRGQDEGVWQSAVNHLVALTLGIEVLDAINSIAVSAAARLDEHQVAGLDLSALDAFDDSLPGTALELRQALERRLWQFEAWVNDVRTSPQPRFLPGVSYVEALISLTQRQIKALEDSTFYVYVDEYENLSLVQQRIINTCLKHSRPPLVFNLAMKRNALQTQDTLGAESVSRIDDFREYDLEDFRDEKEFQVFAAEILFLQVALAGIGEVPVVPDQLRDPNALTARRQKDYCRSVLEAAQAFLPDTGQQRLAESVFADATIRSTLVRRVDLALRNRDSDLKSDRFVRPQLAEASVIVPALLHRKRLKPNDVLGELDRLEKGKENRFTGQTNWIHNNFIGCLLQLYEPHARPCPFYSGFRTFCLLARGNLRHFLELCHKSIYRGYDDSTAMTGPVDTYKQAEAARQASSAFLGEVRSFGHRGNQLHTFVLRIGSLLKLSQQRPSQSEPEVTHFSINRGREPLAEEDVEFLNEATKWSVLFEERETKRKESSEQELVEHVLNPIYAPYLHISYRKRRRLELSSDEAIVLIRGTLDQVSQLLRDYSRKWDLEQGEAQLPLFGSVFEDPVDDDQHAEGE